MAVSDTTPDAKDISAKLLPDLPLVIWMVLIALVLGLFGGLTASDLVALFNIGFGRALGEFALILLPSFTLAAALSRQDIASDAAGRTAALASPVAGAGMICPDTAYAALSPAAGAHKLTLAIGAYTGFKLLYPAGPLIVAAGLGATVLDQTAPATLLAIGLALSLPVWLSGWIWVRLSMSPNPTASADAVTLRLGRLLYVFAPFLVMTVLLVAGAVIGVTGNAFLDFLMLPKGALLCAALLAVVQVPRAERRPCLDSGVRRTGALLLVIGAASAFGAVVTTLLPVSDLVPQGTGLITLVSLFGLTVVFKLAQGSSMATFAAIAPVAAPIVAASGANPIAAVFAICLGSFIAILPNDSYYWLVRGDAFASDVKERAVVRTLAGASIVQAIVGFSMLLLGVTVFL